MQLSHKDIISFLKSKEGEQYDQQLNNIQLKRSSVSQGYEIDITKLMNQQEQQENDQQSQLIQSLSSSSFHQTTVKFNDLFDEASKSLTSVLHSQVEPIQDQQEDTDQMKQSIRDYQIDKLTDKIIQIQAQYDNINTSSNQTIKSLQQSLEDSELEISKLQHELNQYKKVKQNLEQKLCLIRAESDLKVREATCQLQKLEGQKESKVISTKIRDLQQINNDLAMKLSTYQNSFLSLQKESTNKIQELRVELLETKQEFLQQIKNKEMDLRVNIIQLQNTLTFFQEKSSSIELTDNAQQSVINSLKQENQSFQFKNEHLQQQNKSVTIKNQQLQVQLNQIGNETHNSQNLISQMKTEFDGLLKQTQFLEAQNKRAIMLISQKFKIQPSKSIIEMIQKTIQQQYMK
ncbi:hypothetical protein SS50377_25425 [Spironucleus salmonicida]|uniref:Uncharacterized protein n=1 Tax=Spironucleus salmonicida TaxID=348837 RepID=V6LMN0_9EUKA|nr:hypothetical protein SS50377_25425 [Spironucleus salmonicida]|eukprot:EST44971.1 Hypothetical protein SS50377_14990 [Spironucleus salmonicida]